eukprot:1975865-Rhodomonas_salina.1
MGRRMQKRASSQCSSQGMSGLQRRLYTVTGTDDFSQGVFSWVFLLLAWNLISLGSNVGTLMYEVFSWQDNSLRVTI